MRYQPLLVTVFITAGLHYTQAQSLILGTGTGSTQLSASVSLAVPPQAAETPLPTTPPRREVPDHPVLGEGAMESAKAAAAARLPLVPLRQPIAALSTGTSIQLNDATPEFALKNIPAASFDGIKDTSWAPADPVMAVGPDEVLVAVNAGLSRYDRQGSRLGGTSFANLFADLSLTLFSDNCADPFFSKCLIFDPWLQYDNYHGRFILTASASDSSFKRSYLYMAVSNGPNWSGGWKVWALNALMNGSTPLLGWMDYPRFAVDPDGVYVSMNVYSSANQFVYGRVRAIRKADLYNPATTTLPWYDIWGFRNEDGTMSSSLAPAMPRGRLVTAASKALFVNALDVTPANQLVLWTIRNIFTLSPVITRDIIGGLSSYGMPAQAPQKGGSLVIDTGDARVLRAVIRGDTLYTGRNSSYSDAPSTITYDQIDLNTLTTTQSILKGGYFFFPALDVPASVGPTRLLPNLFVMASTSTPAGDLAFPGVFRFRPGTTYYNVTGSIPGTVRWGDYSGAAIDPVSGGMWTYGDYSIATSGTAWSTSANYFPWVTTKAFDDVPASNEQYDFINVLSQWGVTQGCSTRPALYCPFSPVTRGQMAAFVVRALFTDTFTYSPKPYFSDVPASHPFFAYIQKLKETGITKGCSDTQFCPEDSVTRLQTAAFIIRAKMNTLFGDNFTYPADPYFTDVPTNDELYPYAQKLRQMGITQGCSTTEFCPNAAITRSEMAAFLVRAFL
jgi:hypothetical protein